MTENKLSNYGIPVDDICSKCSNCKFVYSNTTIKTHLRKCEYKKEYPVPICMHCGKVPYNIRDVRYHLETRHRHIMNGIIPECPINHEPGNVGDTFCRRCENFFVSKKTLQIPKIAIASSRVLLKYYDNEDGFIVIPYVYLDEDNKKMINIYLLFIKQYKYVLVRRHD